MENFQDNNQGLLKKTYDVVKYQIIQIEEKSSARIMGIIYISLAMFCFATTALLAKILNQRNIGVVQILYIRALFTITFMYLLITNENISFYYNDYNTNWLLFWRSFFGIFCLSLYISGLKFLPLSEALTLEMIAPIVVVFLSCIILKEKVGFKEFFAAFLGFVGVIFIAKPAFFVTYFNYEYVEYEGHWLGVLCEIGSGISYAYQCIFSRMAGDKIHTFVMIHYDFFVQTLAQGLFASSGQTQKYLNLADALIVLLFCICGVFGQIFLTRSYQIYDASKIAPFMYLNLVFAYLFDILLLHHTPDVFSILGTILIVAISGLIVKKDKPKNQVEVNIQ